MSPARPPVAPRLPRSTEIHGERRVDDYFWLRDKENPDVKAYLEAENAYTDAMTEPTRGLQEALYREMLARIKETDVNVPYRKDGFLYYSRTEQGKQYPIHCRKPGSLEAQEQLTLDLNQLAEGGSFMALGVYLTSDDGRLLAYSTDGVGFRQYDLYVKDLQSGAILEKVAERVGSAAWAADNRTIFYTVEEEETKRQYRLLRHQLGSRRHEVVYEERDQAFNVGVGRTRSRQFLVLGTSSHTTSEARFLPAGQPDAEWTLLAPRIPEQEYEIDHHGESFYIRTNDAGRNFRLVKAPVSSPGRASWQELLPHRAAVMLEGMDFFRGHSVLYEREDGLPRVRVTDLATGTSHRVAFPEPTYSVFASQNAEFDTKQFRYTDQSLLTPLSTFDYDMERRESRLLKETEVLGGYDRTRYVSERIWATARDGAQVPISLVYKKDRPRDGLGPSYLYGYGSYGLALPITFSSNRVSLLERGVLVAIAHVRGGGELGKPWHDDGRMHQKRNTFSDFIACAEHLIQQQQTAPERLAIEGASAGGLLAAAVANMRPELWKAVLLKVPFVDVINSMLDESLPLTVGEFEEWGNPKRREDYGVMRSYCPYSNLESKDYPAMLVKTSWSDSQVMYWEPAKYVAKLRTLKTDSRPLLLKTNMAAGHGGASGRYDALREAAFDYAFLLTQLGVA